MSGTRRSPSMHLPRPTPRPPRRGLTLIELLLVMGLIAMVLGAGLGAFASLDPGQRAAVGIVQDLLRTAHNTAVARRAPARVRIDPATGEMVAEGMLVVGTWHFEDETLSGGDELCGVAVGADEVLSEDGWIGRGLDFSSSPRGAGVEVAVQDDPAFDPRLGFAIDLAVRPSGTGAARLLDLGGAVQIEIGSGGSLRASFRRRVADEFGRTVAGGRLAAETPAGSVRPGRWSRLSVQYDRRALRLAVDGVPLATAFAEEQVAALEGPLWIGGGSTPFLGTIDELVVAVVSGEAQGALPSSVRFAEGAPRTIQFAPGGALDPARHREPVRVGIELGDGTVRTVLVSRYGTVE